MKSRAGQRQREEKRLEERRVERERVRRKKMQMREKVGKSRNHCVFPIGSGGSKSRLAKAARAEPAGQMRDEKLHAIVARSTFPSQNVQNTPHGRTTFWKLRCRKSARRCGAKHISKSKCTKHTRCGPLLAVELSKKCTPLWREARLQVKRYKTTPCTDHFWQLRCRKSARRCGAKHISKSKCTKHTMYGPFLEVQMSFRVAGARDCGPCQKWAKRGGFVAFSTTTITTLHYTTLQYITLHYNYNYTFTTFYLLHYATLHYTPLHSSTLHSITLNYTTLHYATLHSTTLHYTTLHYTTLHYTWMTLHHR